MFLLFAILSRSVFTNICVGRADRFRFYEKRNLRGINAINSAFVDNFLTCIIGVAFVLCALRLKVFMGCFDV